MHKAYALVKIMGTFRDNSVLFQKKSYFLFSNWAQSGKKYKIIPKFSHDFTSLAAINRIMLCVL